MVSSTTSINEMLNKAFALAYFIHGDKRLARRIATEAMAKLEVATSAQHKRFYYRPAGRSSHHQGDAKRSKVSFSDLHLLQRLVYVESERYEQQKEQASNSASINEEDMIVHFIKHLVRITLRRNSFYVTLGLSRLLYNYSTPEAMEIYNVVTQDPERVKDDYYYRSRKRLLIEEMKGRFGNLIRMRKGPRGEERFQARPAPDVYLDLVKRCLRFFTPWQTPCLVPQGFDPTMESLIPFSSNGGIEEDKVEINRMHAILEPVCFQRLIEGLGFDAPGARLEVPYFYISQDGDSDEGPRNGRHDPLPLNEQELLAARSELSELATRRKRATAGLLRVLVDGIERARLDPRRADRMRFRIESSAELLEVRGQDDAGEILLASHLFVHDFPGDGFAAYQLPMLLEAGQKLYITVTPTAQAMETAETEELAGASVFVSCRRSSPLGAITRLARQLGAVASARFHSDGRDYRKPLIPIMASLLLAVCAAGIALYVRSGRGVDYQPVISGGQQGNVVAPIDAPPNAGPEAQGLRPPSLGEQIARQQASRQRRQSPFQGSAENRATPTGDAEIELTRDLNNGLPAFSLSEVRKIYIEVTSTEGETTGAGLRKGLIEAPGFNQRLILAAEKDTADALLKISVTRPTSIKREVDRDANRGSEARPALIHVTAQLINPQGKVIWPTGSRISGKKYQGTATEIAPRIVEDLLDAMDKQKR